MPLSKLSGKGWSYNRWVLLLTGEYICYYSKVPPDFANNTIPSGKGKILPKFSINLDYITSIGPITQKDFLKFKKKFTKPSCIFKICYLTAGGTKKGKELIWGLDKSKPKQKITTWFFLTDDPSIWD